MTSVLASLEASGASTWLRESGSIWAYPTVLTLHTLGLAVLVGAHWAVCARVLGAGRDIPLATFERLFRYMWIGFWINLASGLFLLAADATTKTTQQVFLVKLGFVVAGVVVVMMTQRALYPAGATAPAMRMPLRARSLALSGFAVWIAAIAAGRLMAYV